MCPIHGVGGESAGNGSYNATDDATQGETDAADAALAAFDWTDAAHDVWENIDRRKSAKTGMTERSPEDIRRRAMLLVLLDEINLLRTKAGLPLRTAQQFRQAMRNKITSGDADA